MRACAALGLTASAAILSGCASLAPATCPAGQSEGRTVELFFGRNIGDRLGVSEADFQHFVDEELTPRFPEGLTVLDAAGQWRGASGVIGREASKLVILVLPGRAGDEDRLAAVRQAYRARFSQEAVLMTIQPTCLGFCRSTRAKPGPSPIRPLTARPRLDTVTRQSSDPPRV